MTLPFTDELILSGWKSPPIEEVRETEYLFDEERKKSP